MGYAQQNGQKSVVDGYAEAGAIATEVRRAVAVFRSAIPVLSSVFPLLCLLSGGWPHPSHSYQALAFTLALNLAITIL